MITEDFAISQPIAKVGDFGLSQFTYFDMRALKNTGKIGNITPCWAAPEILCQQPYSIQSDIYSLGLLLWEVKYRKMAFWKVLDGGFAMEKCLEAVVSGQRPDVDLSDPYDQLCAQCWADDPQSPSSVSHFFHGPH